MKVAFLYIHIALQINIALQNVETSTRQIQRAKMKWRHLQHLLKDKFDKDIGVIMVWWSW